jgi:hypothetical protein
MPCILWPRGIRPVFGLHSTGKASLFLGEGSKSFHCCIAGRLDVRLQLPEQAADMTDPRSALQRQSRSHGSSGMLLASFFPRDDLLAPRPGGSASGQSGRLNVRLSSHKSENMTHGRRTAQARRAPCRSRVSYLHAVLACVHAMPWKEHPANDWSIGRA